MAKKPHKLPIHAPERIYWGSVVPMREIRRFARAVAERFDPEQIILFGSHAYGRPHRDSDVDILVVMPARNKHSQAVKIRAAVSAPFPMDLLVRTPQEIRRRLSEGDLFHTRKSCRRERSCMKSAIREWVKKAEAVYRGAVPRHGERQIEVLAIWNRGEVRDQLEGQAWTHSDQGVPGPRPLVNRVAGEDYSP